MSALDEACAAVVAFQKHKRETIQRMAGVIIANNISVDAKMRRHTAYEQAGVAEVDVECWDLKAVRLAEEMRQWKAPV